MSTTSTAITVKIFPPTISLMNIFHIVISVILICMQYSYRKELLHRYLNKFRIIWQTIICTSKKITWNSLEWKLISAFFSILIYTLIEFWHLILSLGTIRKLEKGYLPSFISWFEQFQVSLRIIPIFSEACYWIYLAC